LFELHEPGHEHRFAYPPFLKTGAGRRRTVSEEPAPPTTTGSAGFKSPWLRGRGSQVNRNHLRPRSAALCSMCWTPGLAHTGSEWAEASFKPQGQGCDRRASPGNLGHGHPQAGQRTAHGARLLSSARRAEAARCTVSTLRQRLREAVPRGRVARPGSIGEPPGRHGPG